MSCQLAKEISNQDVLHIIRIIVQTSCVKIQKMHTEQNDRYALYVLAAADIRFLYSYSSTISKHATFIYYQFWEQRLGSQT